MQCCYWRLSFVPHFLSPHPLNCYRLVFTGNGFGFGVGVVIRSVALYDLVKTGLCFFWFRLRHCRLFYDQVKAGSSESQVEAEELNQSQSVETCIVIGLSFRFCFRLRQSGFHYIDHKRNLSDEVVRGVGRKWKTFWFFWLRFRRAYDSATTPIFDFHQVISALVTQFMTPTPSLVKTSLKFQDFIQLTCWMLFFLILGSCYVCLRKGGKNFETDGGMCNWNEIWCKNVFKCRMYLAEGKWSSIYTGEI